MSKHPLTSKERRGLTAVAAAALLCIAAGFAVRSCRPAPPSVQVIQQVRPEKPVKADSAGKKTKTRKSGKPSKTKSKKGRSQKTYPSRQPLDEPLDQSL